MSTSERFDRLIALLKEVELKQDKMLADVRLTLEEVLEQNVVLEQMHYSLKRSLASMTNATNEVVNTLK